MNIIVATIFIFSAAILYTVGVWAERFS